MKLYTKIKAGALQFVLFIGAVIAVLLLTFVLLTHSHLFFAKKTNKFIEVIEQNNLALHYAMGVSGAFDLNEFQGSVLSNDSKVAIEKKPWGLFKKYETTTSFEKYSFTTHALTGHGISEQIPALYLKDNQRPLIIVGNSEISGTAFLPEQGIRPGNISGKSYFGTHLVKGQTRQSQAMLPRLDTDVLEEINIWCNQIARDNNQVISLSRNSTIKNSFAEPTQIVFGDYMDLSGIQLTGNIVVMASQEIRVDASTILTDVILSAPKITIGDKVVGAFQAFASKQIVVGKNTLLKYPTALVVQRENRFKEKKNTVTPPSILVQKGAIVKGLIVYKDDSEERQFYPQLKFEPNTSIIGQVYCEKGMELRGDVVGSVYTDSFITLENGNIYQNHLYNGTINGVNLPQQFVGLYLREASSNKKIAKWLY